MSQWYGALLASHIVVAGITAGFVIFGSANIIYRNLLAMRRAAYGLAFSTLAAVISGVVLAIAANETYSVLQLCRNIGIYLAISSLAELALYFNLRRVQLFPRTMVANVLTTCLIVGSVGVALVATTPTASAHVITAKTQALFTATTQPSSVSVDEPFTVGFTLANANTAKRLGKKTITIYYAAVGGSDWISLGQFKTSKKGRVKIELSSPASVKFKARWKPTGTDTQRYKTTTSNIVKVTVE